MEHRIRQTCGQCTRQSLVRMRSSMLKKWTCAFGILITLAILAFAQSTTDKNGAVYPTEEQLARRKRLADILKHPTFINLRLLSTPRDVPDEKSTETPAPFKYKDWISFRLFASQSLFDDIEVSTFRHPYAEVRPVLKRDGEIVPYNKQAQAGIESDSALLAPADQLRLKPGLEYQLQEIHLDDWYDELPLGRYELTVQRRFNWQGDWLTSTPIYFEVQARTPGTISPGVIIELTPEGAQPKADGKPYQLGNEVLVNFLVRNKSDQPLKINVIDREYGNQPHLFKNGVLIPYREDLAAIIKSKEENPRLVAIVNDFYLDPKVGTWPDGLDLTKWYGKLSPGSYRLVIRHRFEIDGPWSDESKPLLFEISATKRNQH
jgi:hypothetical protein